jgi:hypothetical protein
VLSKEERDSLRRSGARDPAKKREEKIRQYKWEKEVRTRLQVSPLSIPFPRSAIAILESFPATLRADC